MTHFDNKVLIILGPTASGKSRLAMAIAKALDGVIINADSMQVYKNFPILSAMPSTDHMNTCPHKLYGLFDLEKNHRCSAAKWVDLATAEIQKTLQQQKLPILVGGTGLYIKALLEGLSTIPKIPSKLRTFLMDTLEDPVHRQKLYAHLKQQDPQTQIKLGDTQRLIRALEVLFYTGKPLSVWQQETKNPNHPWQYHLVTLQPERQQLYNTINKRSIEMLEKGALEEVERFTPPKTTLPSSGLGSIGYTEIKLHLAGTLSREDLLTKLQQKTRNYAKRQLTWLRHQVTPDLVISA